LIGRLIGRMPFAPTQTKSPFGDWRNSTRAGGFRATRTLRVSAACAQRKRLCRRGFNRPVFFICG